MSPSFSLLNYSILFAYLAGMVWIGFLFAGRQRTPEDYFLAGRRMPWLAVGMSMYASLTSAVTYMGLPGMAFKSNIALIVVCVVSPLLAPVLVSLFYPFYHRLRVTTSYEYIDRRFGRSARVATSGLFLLARLGWLGTVIYAPALALHVATGMELWLGILMMGAMATLYTVMGGLSAVVWTDVVQFVILVAGAIWVAVVLIARIPGGAGEIIAIARAHDHLGLDWSVSLYEMSALVVAVSFFCQMMQDYGTDQVTVQRLMAIGNRRGVVKAVCFNAGTDLVIVAALLFIGLGLFAYYHVFPAELPDGLSSDRVFPYFIVHVLPDGVSGLLIAAIFAAAMSSMDSGIHSMATVIVTDLIAPLRHDRGGGHADVRLARLLTLGLGAFSTGIAFVVSRMEGIVESFATFMSLFSAPVLALFLLGMLTRRGTFRGWCVGAGASIAATWWLQNRTQVSWVYYFPFSLAISLALGYLASRVLPRPAGPAPAEGGLTVWDARAG